MVIFTRISFILSLLAVDLVPGLGPTYWGLKGVKYTSFFQREVGRSKLECATSCDRNTMCKSFSHTSTIGECLLTTTYPPTVSPAPPIVYDDNSRIYYLGVGPAQNLTAVRAWQSTIEKWANSGPPERAIDGNTNGDFYQESCAHTQQGSNNFWATELSAPSTIRAVEVWWRTECCMDRARDLEVIVSRNQTESDNGIGQHCNYFTGPADLTTNPSIIICQPAVYGQVVRLVHHLENSWLHFCEVFIYSDY